MDSEEATRVTSATATISKSETLERRKRMWGLAEVRILNERVMADYRARTSSRQRLANRLESLAITSEDENALILAAFDAACVEEQQRMERMDIWELRQIRQ